MKPIPPKLYKYRPFDVFALRLLTQAQVYYSDPRQFNDPLDCDPTIEVDIDREALEQVCYHFLRQTKSEREAVDVISNRRYLLKEYGDYETDPEIDAYLKRMLASDIKDLLVAELGAKGVLSLSEIWQSPLMWSHYADEHRGLCIEYDTTQIPHPDLGPVDYRAPRSVKASDLARWKMEGSAEAGRQVHQTYFFAKSGEWDYEREWRYIARTSGVLDVGLPITAIHFGLRCDAAVVTGIVTLLSSLPNIELYEIYPLDNSFSLERRSVDRDEIAACGIRTSTRLLFKDVILPKAPGSAGKPDDA
jgi:hypothetical protein